MNYQTHYKTAPIKMPKINTSKSFLLTTDKAKALFDKAHKLTQDTLIVFKKG